MINTTATATATGELKTAEDELVKLATLFNGGGKWVVGGFSTVPVAVARRVEVLLNKIESSQAIIDKLAEEASKWKKVGTGFFT